MCNVSVIVIFVICKCFCDGLWVLVGVLVFWVFCDLVEK